MILMSHLPHGILILVLDKKIPRSHTIIDEMVFNDEEISGKVIFDSIQESDINRIIVLFGKIFQEIDINIRLYFYLSILCTNIDVAVLCYTLREFGVKGEEDDEIFLMRLCAPFLFVNLFWG